MRPSFGDGEVCADGQEALERILRLEAARHLMQHQRIHRLRISRAFAHCSCRQLAVRSMMFAVSNAPNRAAEDVADAAARADQARRVSGGARSVRGRAAPSHARRRRRRAVAAASGGGSSGGAAGARAAQALGSCLSVGSEQVRARRSRAAACWPGHCGHRRRGRGLAAARAVRRPRPPAGSSGSPRTAASVPKTPAGIVAPPPRSSTTPLGRGAHPRARRFRTRPPTNLGLAGQEPREETPRAESSSCRA